MNKQSMVDSRLSMAHKRPTCAKAGQTWGTQPSMSAVGHFSRFSFVGAIGIGVQLTALELIRRAGVDYLTATALAVEITIVHNFIWHERFTWVDRTRMAPREWLRRVVSFNVTNGAVSLLGNVVLMRLLVGQMHLPVLLSNLLAISACWVLNFVVSDRVVFARTAVRGHDSAATSCGRGRPQEQRFWTY